MQFPEELTAHAAEWGRLWWGWTTDLYQAVTTVLLLVAQVVLLVFVLVAGLVLSPALATIQALELVLRYMQNKTR